MPIMIPAGIVNRTVPAPDIVLFHMLQCGGQGGGRVERHVETQVPVGFVIAGVFHRAHRRVMDVAKILDADAGIHAPFSALSHRSFQASDV